MRTLLAVLLVCLASGAVARDLRVDETAIRGCFAATLDHQTSIGCAFQAANECQSLVGGSTTIGIVDCLALEAKVWDAILNEEYAQTRTHFGAQVGTSRFLDHLRTAQRAWITFRDAECALAHERGFGGSIRVIYSASCTLRLTALRAFDLRSLRNP